ncbi:Transposable element tcb1 transposase [Oopsacas minuta]|uniref:Transposable element tcb1 transposase n=1 Tax=Oopsacas minuta TaxID=111878 RepID=A0AAV7JZA1_9METZ|nr:Transposable element tcb1 transposase [Oopsacas minuta]
MNVGDHGIAIRSKAIGMLEAGISQKDVALRLGAGLRSIKRWRAAAKRGVTCLDAISRSSKTGSIVKRSMLLNMSDFLFMQDGVPAHTAKATQEWCTINFSRFWKKGEWSVNSPDLNPIENLWSILTDRVDKLGQVNTIQNLIQNIKLAWISIDANVLNNLVSGMPDRIRKVVELHGDYIGQ